MVELSHFLKLSWSFQMQWKQSKLWGKWQFCMLISLWNNKWVERIYSLFCIINFPNFRHWVTWLARTTQLEEAVIKEKGKTISQEAGFYGESPKERKGTNYFCIWANASLQAWHLLTLPWAEIGHLPSLPWWLLLSSDFDHLFPLLFSLACFLVRWSSSDRKNFIQLFLQKKAIVKH